MCTCSAGFFGELCDRGVFPRCLRAVEWLHIVTASVWRTVVVACSGLVDAVGDSKRLTHARARQQCP